MTDRTFAVHVQYPVDDKYVVDRTVYIVENDLGEFTKQCVRLGIIVVRLETVEAKPCDVALAYIRKDAAKVRDMVAAGDLNPVRSLLRQIAR